MKKSIFTNILIILFIVCVATSAQAKYASIVIDVTTRQVLHEENADTKNYPASLTKMMTLLLVFEAIEEGKLKLESKLLVSRKATLVSPIKLGLIRGQYINVETAILALTVKSANDVAVVIAESLASSEQEFAKLMTKKAHQLGMTNTYFKNASGLPNKGQVSSARDMAILGIVLLEKFPQYYHYFSNQEFSYQGHDYKTHNRLLLDYEGADGIKTGYTRSSGYNLVASVLRDKTRLIAVVLGGKTKSWRDNHIRYLLNKSFNTIVAIDE